MNKKMFVLFITFLFLTNLAAFASSTEVTKQTEIDEEDWYYLPSYPNYAPSGLPDFSQIQQEDWRGLDGGANLCGAVSLANILWWFDSRHSNCHGTPGDGKDSYSLVQTYHKQTTSDPGPNPDDHNYNNVNDNSTPWNRFRRNGELIERIAWYTNRQKDAHWTKLLLRSLRGPFNAFKLIYGTIRWLRETNQLKSYTVRILYKPDFTTINNCLRKDNGIVLGINSLDDNGNVLGGHFVSVAGINTSGYIAFSDPFFDITNPSSNPAEHNNASIVSHDIYEVNFTSPYPKISKWWIPGYSKRGCFIPFAMTISDQI